MINIKTNIAQFIKTEIKEYEKIVKRATIAATNKVAAQGKSETSRVIRERYTIKARDLSKEIRVTKTGPVTASGASIWMRAKKGIPLIKFKHRATKRGVNISVIKGRSVLSEGAFIATMPSGHKGIFKFMMEHRKRRKPAPRYEERKNYLTQLPIDEMIGPSPSVLFGSKKVTKKVIAFIIRKYPKLYEDAFNHFKKK